VDFWSTTLRSGGGCRVTPWKFSVDCDRPTTVGEWTLTYIRVKGEWRYLYRAVDSSGATIDFLLSAKQDAAAAERFLAKALGRQEHPGKQTLNL
jgi:transposase-like protein